MAAPSNSLFMQGILSALHQPVADRSSNEYLSGILQREAVAYGFGSPASRMQSVLAPLLQHWAGSELLYLAFSGSYAKGTANRSGTDVDILISLRASCRVPLRIACVRLMKYLTEQGFPAKLQNVSVGTEVHGRPVDLVPARQYDDLSDDHSIFHRKTGTWRKTNINTHIRYVNGCGHRDVIRLIKLWRDQLGLVFPSFYLELAIIRALEGHWYGSLAERVLVTLEYLSGSFLRDRFTDPANTNNVISDDLTGGEKLRIRAAALASLRSNWSRILR